VFELGSAAGERGGEATWTAVPARMLTRALRRHRCRPTVTATATTKGSAATALSVGTSRSV
jgi:hypothetical protein